MKRGGQTAGGSGGRWQGVDARVARCEWHGAAWPSMLMSALLAPTAFSWRRFRLVDFARLLYARPGRLTACVELHALCFGPTTWILSWAVFAAVRILGVFTPPLDLM